jgi:hypothetical protein
VYEHQLRGWKFNRNFVLRWKRYKPAKKEESPQLPLFDDQRPLGRIAAGLVIDNSADSRHICGPRLFVEAGLRIGVWTIQDLLV